MDDSVIAAIAKWPHVPAVFGWLILTARGEWRLRGESIANQAICDFIGRNYTHDEQGRWFFQNGPQRVFVDLEVTPWIWRVGAEPGAALRSHTHRPAERLHGAWLDESGRLFLQTDIGFGLLDGRIYEFNAKATIVATGNCDAFLERARAADVPARRIGTTGGSRLVIRGAPLPVSAGGRPAASGITSWIDLPLTDIEAVWARAIPRRLEQG